MNKYWNILEFNKIIDELKKSVRLDINKDELDKVILYEDVDDIILSLNEVDEASKLIQRMNQFPLYFNNNIYYLLDKTKKYVVASNHVTGFDPFSIAASIKARVCILAISG